ncbi:hypothetical protein T265_02303 [Opisthorchis viverrini]|uniref:DUF7083 domain-containing protein n=1 Tax=Opisthorchis viverrini TaxID=6198 RepID=A0A074ZWN6_OPIVI|nr:hypothetical protein T265_02303 [Opisthorchis viverrini]KER31536.1 hypothetical protein T265_02303 [Opisthorchis viverrini]
MHATKTIEPPSSSRDAVVREINKFDFDPESGQVSAIPLKQPEDMFGTNFAQFNVARKVRLLLRKLSIVGSVVFANFMLLKPSRDLDFADSIKILNQIFVWHRDTGAIPVASGSPRLQDISAHLENFIPTPSSANLLGARRPEADPPSQLHRHPGPIPPKTERCSVCCA